MKVRLKGTKVVTLILIVGIITMFGVAMQGCSSGGGSDTTNNNTSHTLSGTVAAGAPMVALVYLKDSTGTVVGPVQPASDGSFSFDVTGLTPPFYLQAVGAVTNTSYTLYSVATGAGTANINPLTTLAVASAAGVNDPAAVYSNPAASPITQQSLDQAVTNIQSMLQLQLDAYSANVNPVTAAYSADHAGLDAVLDVISVNTNTVSGIVEIVSTMTGTLMSSAAITDLANPTVSLTVSKLTSTQTMQDIQDIQTMFTNLVTVLNKGGSGSLQASDLDPFFASASTYGLNDGLNSAATITGWASDFNNWSKTYVKMIISVDAALTPGDYLVQARSYFSDGSYYDLWPTGLIVTNESGWKLKGNGYKSAVPISVETHKWVYSDGTSTILSGIDFYMKDMGNNDLQAANITGPGLPAPGIDMVKSAFGNYFVFQTPAVLTRAEFYPMTDTDIDAIPDNAVYTIAFYDSGAALVETRTVKVPKRPFRSTEFANIFTTLSAPTTHVLADASIGGSFTFTYTKPAAYVTIWITTGMEFNDGGSNRDRSGDVQAMIDQNSITITTTSPTTWTPTKARFMLNATDQYRRSPYLWWDFQ